MADKKIETAAAAETVADIASPAPVADAASPTAVATAQTDAEQGDAETVTDAKGFQVRKAFAMKQFLPHPNWINQNIVAHGQGTKATLGRVFGIATATERKRTTMNDGTVSESIYVKGSFEAESYIDGVVSRSAGVFLPMAYAEQIELALRPQLNEKGEEIRTVFSAEIDCDIGLEATGKIIPYAWTVTAFREGAEMDVLKRVRSTRAKPASVLSAPSGEVLQIAAPKPVAS